MNRIKEILRKFFYGRYGIDRFNQSLIYFVFILSVLNIFVYNSRAKVMLNFISFIVLAYTTFRILSKNINQRYQENIKFMKATKPFRGEIDLLKLKWKDRKTHRYIRCDKCHNIIRAPKNVGKIKIRCQKCGNEFIKRV